MFLYERTPALILRQLPRGESDLLITLYTQEYGRIDVLARSVREMSSKLKSCADLFTFGQAEFIQGKNIKTLTDFWPDKKWSRDISAWSCLDKASELLLHFLKEEEKDDNVWRLLVGFLDKIEKPELAYHWLAWNLIFLQGYWPQLDSCCLCSKKIESGFFSPEDGGIICCQSRPMKVEKETIDILKKVKSREFFDLKSLPKNTKDLLNYYLAYLLE